MTEIRPTPVAAPRLHRLIMEAFLERGHPPTIADLSASLDAPPPAIEEALQTLADEHGVVLHPNGAEIWVAHPFSASPTAFWVEADERGWWGNCAWCSLGIATLAGGSVTIHGRLGGERDPACVRLVDGAVTEGGNLRIHFPIPMRRAWENVIHTCSTMLLFESEAAIDEWCLRHRIPKGDVRSVAAFAPFAAAWYGRHLADDWRKWSSAEARAMFARFGLTGPIWSLEESAARF